MSIKKTTKKHLSKANNKRVPTGIPGFDKLVQGGFPKNSSILVVGGPGTGKTIFCLQFLYQGALDYKEKGLFVTFEQRVEDVKKQAKQFGWNIDKLEKKGLLEIVYVPISKINKGTIDDIKEKIRKKKIKRLVIDSLSTLIVNAPIYTNPSELSVEDVVGENVIFSPPIVGDYIVKRFVYGFIDSLREIDSTNLFIGEANQSAETLTRDSISEFACDGIVSITFESLGGEFSRSMIIRKMRCTKNDEDIHPLEIGKKGIVVHEVLK